MNVIGILIALVVLGIGLAILYRILLKIFPLFGIGADWISIIMAIVGLVALVSVLNMLGFGPAWFAVR